ncbi:MAG: alpha/beta hydrolase [Verrucomicrobia bacterium]|nr:alpha/beta hydrolase [Verrucomicrobiota bacterium]
MKAQAGRAEGETRMLRAVFINSSPMKLAITSLSLAVVIAALAVPGAWAQAAKGRGAVKLTTAELKTIEQVFKQTPQGELKLYVHYPPDRGKDDRRPAIIFFFGGAWKHGSPAQFLPQAEYFAARGLVSVRADYRISSKHQTTPEKCIEDAKSAVRWLRSHAGELGVDPDKIIASGGSAGGHLAAATALVPGHEAKEDDAKVSCKPNALVLFNPALHFPEFSVKDADGNPLKDFWPTPFLKKGAPPAILFFGTNDKMVTQGREYLAKSKELGCRAELYTAEGQGHGFFNRSPWTEITARQADLFLASLGYLQGEPALKLPDGAPALKREE